MVAKKPDLRVIIAAEYPEVRNFLRKIVEEEDKAVTVGEARDAFQALSLARDLKPDIAIIDSYLPHVVGLDTVPLSRIGGLDTAQTISTEILTTRVILLNNLDMVTPADCLTPDGGIVCSITTLEADTPITLQDLQQEIAPPKALVFANVAKKPRTSLNPRNMSLSEKTVFFGGLGIAGGWALIITIIFAPAGVFLTLAGVITVLFGLAGKLVTKLRRRFLSTRLTDAESKAH